MKPILGIDLGTTNSVMAFMRSGRPEIIPNREGDALTPSVVAFTEDKTVWVGKLARAQAVANPDRTIFSIKRQMGMSASHQEVPSPVGNCIEHTARVISSIKRYMGSPYVIEVDGRRYTPQQISAFILAKLKSDAESFFEEPITKAVITVPAYFNDTQRRATKDAGTIAGLEVVRIINEPTAAALAYGLDLESSHRILVWDLGGGTFDVSLLELGGGVFEVKAVCGDTRLGGDDYDERLAGHLARRFEDEWGIPIPNRDDGRAKRSLIEAAESAKIKLSTSASTTVRLPLARPYGQFTETPAVTVTREEFEELTTDLTLRMVAPTRQVFRDAGIDPVEIDRLILVGGATRMPAVRRLAQEITGLRPYLHIDPDKVVALGAAIQAGVLAGETRNVTLVDVNPLSLGIEAQGGVFARIIERNTPIPTSKGQLFTNARDDQTLVEVHVLQGEREMAAHNVSLGRFELSGLEPQRRGEAKVEITFDIDASGMLNVSAFDLQTNNKKRVRIDAANRLSSTEIERMVNEARTHTESDRREREKMMIAIRAENLIRAASILTEKAQEFVESSAIQRELNAVDEAGSLVREALAAGDVEKIGSRARGLEQALFLLDRRLKAEECLEGRELGVTR